MTVGYENQTNREKAVDFCAVYADKSVFDVDNVKVKLSFGRLFDEANEENSSVYLAFFTDALIFGDSGMTENINATEKSECIAYEIKNYNAENYSCQRVTDASGNTVGIRFCHEEEVTLPKELFLGNYKRLYMRIYDKNPHTEENVKLLLNTAFNYFKFDNKVYLSQN